MTDHADAGLPAADARPHAPPPSPGRRGRLSAVSPAHTCGECRFMHPDPEPRDLGAFGDGECRRYHPRVKAGDAARRRAWPMVCAGDACGEFKPIMVDGIPTGPAGAAILPAVVAWIAPRLGASIVAVGDPGEIGEADGWFDAETVYLRRERLWEAAAGRLPEGVVSRYLDRAGCLAKTEGDRNAYVRWVPKVGRIPCYAMRRSALGL